MQPQDLKKNVYTALKEGILKNFGIGGHYQEAFPTNLEACRAF